MSEPVANISVTDRLSSLGDHQRLRMLRLLEAEELSVGEVARVLQLPQSTVSRHLKILSAAGWLEKRLERTATYYQVVLDDLGGPERELWVAVRRQMGDGPELAEDNRRLAEVLASRSTDSLSFFGRVAGEWDALRTELFGDHFLPHGLLALVPSDWVVADLGCGTGNAAEMLAPHVERVIAVDQSDVMIDAARRRLGDAGRGFRNVEFRVGPMEALPLDDASVDAVCCSLVLHHVEQPAEAMREVARVLRPGGVALVIEMTEHGRTEFRKTMGHQHLGFSEADLSGLLSRAGLVTPRTVHLPAAPDAKGPGLLAATARRERTH